MLVVVPGRSRAGAGPESQPAGSRARVRAGRKRELSLGRSRGRAGAGPRRSGVSARAGPERSGVSAKAGPEPGRSRARVGPERSGVSVRVGPEPGQSQSGAEAGRGRSRQPGRSRASVRWRTAGATCSSYVATYAPKFRAGWSGSWSRSRAGAVE